MKIKDLVKELNQIKNKDRPLQVLIGNEDEDSIGCEIFSLMHTDNCEQAVEIFCHEKDIYNI